MASTVEQAVVGGGTIGGILLALDAAEADCESLSYLMLASWFSCFEGEVNDMR